MKKFHIASICLGTAFLFFLIWKIGPSVLWRDLYALGWGLVPFILIEGVVKAANTIAWRFCLSRPLRSIPFSRLFLIYLAGSSVNYITPTSRIGGEVVKGAILSADHSGSEAVSGVIVGKLASAFSFLLFATLGSLFYIWLIPLPAPALYAAFFMNGLIGAGIVIFMLLQKYGKLGSFVRWIAGRNIGGAPLRKASSHMTTVDQALTRYYREDPWGLPVAMLWHSAGMAAGMVKIWYFLFIMAGHSVYSAAGIWFLSTWLDLLSFSVPLEIGIQEGIRVLAFSALGYPAALGLSFGIALRIEQIFWAGAGLLVYAALLPGTSFNRLLSLPKVADGDK